VAARDTPIGNPARASHVVPARRVASTGRVTSTTHRASAGGDALFQDPRLVRAGLRNRAVLGGLPTLSLLLLRIARDGTWHDLVILGLFPLYLGALQWIWTRTGAYLSAESVVIRSSFGRRTLVPRDAIASVVRREPGIGPLILERYLLLLDEHSRRLGRIRTTFVLPDDERAVVIGPARDPAAPGRPVQLSYA
jgi:hypothetical protein